LREPHEAELGAVDLLYAILPLEALDQGADDHVHAWHDTAACGDHGLGLTWIAVDFFGSCRPQKLKARLQLAHLRIELLLQAEGPRLSEQRRRDTTPYLRSLVQG